ncbi:membrane-associated phospholipid phosphatase [Clostridium acetobutylicum]|uniref:Protein of phosphatidic acid phosphatase family, YNBD E.coli ortholog n=1 Tax=Clostridium acetobutylicum (strain ATCC 824 / DSM 792 / JCM 1419 / IAM 19013 / LMG 5710 / NBRC 13948 / NRRL B-527 / VKM B-1787 / 2291 / W) TaxID=272562 RepID=Q97IZ7_CLOAB|nr:MULTISPECIES: phosphatase PAP2 family protein [Clostridium]AAK79457.1 Protein of phosphatidic acid phosphatase family, YNBD E.coli ortholog [Clostridium acetobutylicum ATCC 824]ADZ20542.1 Protein of phosphatidic acid phosphatase family [Clostridium acetobutylicum EA 2018]AEI31835.1 phosphatidic acid phosphatase [Clostridium acetobutylicum DSM 1731]AWV81297.1 phosphatase PAP2 family protein [Clostridium acetobutylicum]KHD36237.1 phosphatidic acid phosphatase [Clostridium acetobutylicum]
MRLMKRIYNYIPEYAIKPLILCVIFNFSVYSGARLFYKDAVFHNLTSYLDNKIPVVPIFTVIYLGSYIFWIINYILISKVNKNVCYRLIMADLLGKLICGIIYIVYPTTNIRPHIVSSGIFVDMLKFLYSVDAANNLFPSIHCLVSWYCFAGIRNCKTIPVWYRYLSLFIAIMICVSTLTTKQHVIIDVFGGVILAELTWQLSYYLQLYKAFKFINQEV